jgi:tRNA A-37 threonylcarbamoyl transferase component Bud32/tetratricopeptide (TPR) repeat protein
MADSGPAPVLGAGRFELRGTLGAGGAGVVYRAFDRDLQREVALKLLRQASGRDLYRFKREFRALADIVHPNLVALHELHATDGDWFFTMELVEGMSFIDWVRPGRAGSGPARTRSDILASRVTEGRLRGALVQLVDALLALHKAGKLHRDLKPSNVLVTEQGRVALLDFGLVTSFDEDRPERLAVGTPVYMSPEQAADQVLTEASDWYSLGAMLYEALTGRRPFEGEAEQVMTRKQTELPLPPVEVVPGLAADLSALCMRMLQPAPRVRPDGMQILEALGATPSPKTRDIATSAAPVTFVGRSRELGELRRAVVDARRRGVAVFVRGKSGMGKSALVRKFLRSLTDTVFVLEGRCFEREQVPFKMLDGIVDMLTAVMLVLPPADVETFGVRDLGSLVRLFPVLRRVRRLAELAEQSPVPADPAELRRRSFKALRSVFVRLARLRPLVLYVDDVHWGDADSAAFLAEMIAQGDPGIALVLAHRPEDYLGIVKKLVGHGGASARRGEVREIEIGALPEEDAVALVSQLVKERPRADAVVRAAGGNPLVLAELARVPELAPGTRIDDVVRQRVMRLSAEAQALLAVTSIAARPIPFDVAVHAAGVTGAHDHTTALVGERLATVRRVEDQTILQPAHDFVRAAVLAGLDHEVKASWHENLARAFEEIGGESVDSQAVVEHWIAAGHPANAAHHAVNAAQRAEDALAFRRAAELYDIALTYGEWDAPGQRTLLRRKGNALACAGALDEAATVYGHAAQLVPDEEAIDLERLRIEALLRRGRLDEALPAAEQLLAQLGIRASLRRARLGAGWVSKLRGLDFTPRDAATVDRGELLRIDVLASITSGLLFIDPSLGKNLQPELSRAALECGEPVRVCAALAQEVCYAATAGQRNDAAALRLAALATELADPDVTGRAEAVLGIAAYMSGRFDEARTRLEAGLGVLRDHGGGGRWERDMGETYWLSALWYLGDWRELLRNAQLLLRDAGERGDVVAQQGIRLGRPALGWLVAGKPADASEHLVAAEKALPPGFHLPHVLAVQTACNIELATGNAAAAAKRLGDAWDDIERTGALRLQHMRIELEALRARVALADTSRPLDDQLRVVKAVAERLADEKVLWATGLAEQLRAEVFAARDERGLAIAALHDAERALVTCNMTGYILVAKLRRGLLEGGPVGVARAEAARDSLRELGAADPDAVARLLVPRPS